MVCLLCGTHAKAQFQTLKPEYHWGVSAGTTFTTVGFTPKVNQSTLMGYTGGVAFRYIAERYAALLIELNYAQCGWKEDFGENPYNYQRVLTYIELPAMAHIYFGKKSSRFFINAGPKIGFFLGEKETKNFTVEDQVSNPSGQKAQYDLLVKNKFDYGICGGLGYEFRSKAGSFMLEGRYCFGLGDIFGNGLKDNFGASSNQQISAVLKYMFRISKK